MIARAIEQAHRFVDDELAGSSFQKAVQAGPGLVAAEIEAAFVRDVTDVVVGQLENVGVAKRRSPLDLLAQNGEELAGHADKGHVTN